MAECLCILCDCYQGLGCCDGGGCCDHSDAPPDDTGPEA